MVPVTGAATLLLPLERVPLCATGLLEERAWELLLTEEPLPLDRVVVPLEREVEVPLERVALLPVDRVACWLLLPEERETCWLLPLERVVPPEDRLAELEDERLLEELLLLERVVVVPPPEREERD